MSRPVSDKIAVDVRDLRKSFGSLEVLKGVSLQAHEGDVISILGASGSGKSTMLRCINFLEVPDLGHIRITGEDIGLKKAGTAWRRRICTRSTASVPASRWSFRASICGPT